MTKLDAWIHHHPVDGEDFPGLMASPRLGEDEAGNRAVWRAWEAVISGWGLKPGSVVESPSVDGVPVRVLLDDNGVSLSGLPDLVARIGIWCKAEDWMEAARQRGQVLIALAVQTPLIFPLPASPWPGGPQPSHGDVFRWYLDEAGTLKHAAFLLVPVATSGGASVGSASLPG